MATQAPSGCETSQAGGALEAADEDSLEAAVAFAGEFARLGYSAPRLMELFADPFYGPAHGALRRLGEPIVRQIVAAAVSRRAALSRPTP